MCANDVPETFKLAPIPCDRDGKRVRSPLSLPFLDTSLVSVINLNALHLGADSTWNQCKTIVAESGDKCEEDWWVVCISPITMHLYMSKYLLAL
jgi:hypothetical protein